MQASCHTRFALLNLIIPIIFGQEYKLETPHNAIFPSHLLLPLRSK
jgi:hypothetical protein